MPDPFLPPVAGHDPLAALLAEARLRARRTHRPVLVSRTEPAPDLDLLDALARAAAPDYGAPERTPTERCYWERPADGVALAGVGSAVLLAPTGDRRFATAARAWAALLDGALVDDAGAPPPAGPALVGGFSFDPDGPRDERWRAFPAAMLVLPRLQLTRAGGRTWLTTNVLVRADGLPDVDPTSLARLRAFFLGDRAERPSAPPLATKVDVVELTEVPAPERWRASVGEAAAAVRAGWLEKVVLARELRAHAPAPFDAFDALRTLRARYPECFVFAVWRGAHAFLGASPELLARVDGRTVHAASLAGTASRGRTPAEDAASIERLRASAKDRAEHRVVTRTLRGALAELADDVQAHDEPALLTVSNVHHLQTMTRGVLREGKGLLDVAARLHPTPAVGGAPRDEALRFVREHEAIDRGWYAAPIGWIGRDGGELAVALRSAVVHGAEASLFAGCGIMGDSTPEEEYAEAAVKLRPMREALRLPADAHDAGGTGGDADERAGAVR